MPLRSTTHQATQTVAPRRSTAVKRLGAGALLLTLVWSSFAAATPAAEPFLPGTRPLEAARPLDELMLEGLDRFCLRELEAARHARRDRLLADSADLALWPARAAERRTRLRAAIGAVDPRLTAGPRRDSDFEPLATLDRSSVVARHARTTVRRVRWPVLEGVTAEGLWIEPPIVRAAVVALPDADWTPEMFCGIEPGAAEPAEFVRRLVDAGCLVVVPTLIDRRDDFSGHPQVGWTNQSHREFLYRQAFELGRHPLGYEVHKTLAAVDLLERRFRRPAAAPSTAGEPAPPIGIAGFGEGGLIALHAAALDERLQSTLVAGHFAPRDELWREPIERNVWGLLVDFGDAELAALVAPRRLTIEACRAVETTGVRPARDGRRASAAPGRIVVPSLDDVRVEQRRAAEYFRRLDAESSLLLASSGDDGRGPPGTEEALRSFAAGLQLEPPAASTLDPWIPGDAPPLDPLDRRRRQFEELQTHVQTLLRLSAGVRDAQWRPSPTTIESWQAASVALRNEVANDLIGRLPGPKSPAAPRSRRFAETDRYVAYEVLLDVVPDVIAGGILLLPKDQPPGEKRPLVVCQHGLESLAADTFTREPQAYAYYKAFAEELVRRGFIVYAPQNPYRGGDRFRTLQRKSNPLRRSLFSYIVAQHEQTLDWLATLPEVDAERIGFYGLSYGGKTAMRVPPLVDRYRLAICSGDFTDWVRVIATNEERYGYAFTGEYEIPEWNLGHVASYAELAMLMAPRPFLVEHGHRDGGTPTEWVTSEFGKVRRHYDQLGIGDRTEIACFDGPHTIHGVAAFKFLHRHLNRPEPR